LVGVVPPPPDGVLVAVGVVPPPPEGVLVAVLTGGAVLVGVFSTGGVFCGGVTV
jgi:hypothetical protein